MDILSVFCTSIHLGVSRASESSNGQCCIISLEFHVTNSLLLILILICFTEHRPHEEKRGEMRKLAFLLKISLQEM